MQPLKARGAPGHSFFTRSTRTMSNNDILTHRLKELLGIGAPAPPTKTAEQLTAELKMLLDIPNAGLSSTMYCSGCYHDDCTGECGILWCGCLHVCRGRCGLQDVSDRCW